ncbi:MAG: DUF6542 domain-containing protein [Nocardioides sp.]
MSSTRTPPRKTLWEEGRHPGRLVAHAAGAAALLVVLAHLLLTDDLTVAFDVAFVMICVAAALAVRPRDFFVVGVLPPLLMAGTVLVLAIFARGAVADPRDGVVQATVSGLAHHAGALVLGYVLALVVLALRQVAMRNSGTIRGTGRGRAQRRTSAVTR